MKFRIATPKDTECFYEKLIQDTDDMPLKLGLYGIDDELLKNTPYKVSFVGEIDGEPACYLKVSCSDLTMFAYINLLYVTQEHRRKGLGLHALKFAEGFCMRNWNSCGIDFLTIQNEPMGKLAKKAGFKLSGTYKKRYFLNGYFYDESRYMKMIEKRKTLCQK